MLHEKIAIIGGGNMGESIASGLISTGFQPSNICIADPDPEKLAVLQNKLHVTVNADNQTAIATATIIILAVKPQLMAGIACALTLRKDCLVISVAAGIPLSQLETWLGISAIVRCMPNTPALIGCGATALIANSYVNEAQRKLAEKLLQSVGLTVWVTTEDQIDAVTALSGSGPAYFFLIIEILQNVGHSLGLDKNVADILALQTAYGASRMALESDESVLELRKRVTSSGGTTDAAVKILEANNIRTIFSSALKAAKDRAAALALISKGENP